MLSFEHETPSQTHIFEDYFSDGVPILKDYGLFRRYDLVRNFGNLEHYKPA